MQAYLRVQMTEATTYNELKDRIESYLRSMRSTATSSGGDHAPMDIGAVTNYKGGKGQQGKAK
eukprot:352387-Amphidinium_carterae.1